MRKPIVLHCMRHGNDIYGSDNCIGRTISLFLRIPLQYMKKLFYAHIIFLKL